MPGTSRNAPTVKPLLFFCMLVLISVRGYAQQEAAEQDINDAQKPSMDLRHWASTPIPAKTLQHTMEQVPVFGPGIPTDSTYTQEISLLKSKNAWGYTSHYHRQLLPMNESLLSGMGMMLINQIPDSETRQLLKLQKTTQRER